MGIFTHNMSWDANKIISPCTIDVNRYARKESAQENSFLAKALWDTGATVTVISELLVQQLGLIPTDFMRVAGYDGKPQLRNVYKIDIIIGDALRFNKLNVIEAPIITTDILIGMDVIAQGDLTFTHNESNTILTFSSI